MVSTILLSSCAQETQGSATVINLEADAFQKQISNTECNVVDVRTPNEVASGYIPGAIFIDYFSDDFEQKLNRLDKSKPTYLYCASGNRSSKAANKLIALGFQDVYNLKGGFNHWQALEFKIAK